MLLLTSTSDLVRVVTGSSASVEVHADWCDNNAGAITPGRTNTAAITSATTTTVVSSPASGVQRNVKNLSIKNDHATVSTTVEVYHDDASNQVTLWKGTLLAGELVVYDQEGVWTQYGSNGIKLENGVSGLLVNTTLLTSGTSFTTGPRTNSIRVTLVAGGGGGGNSTGNATQSAVAGGGGAGGMAIKVFTVTPSTAYTYAIGGAGASGAAGTNTTFTVGATTVTANGGSAGAAATQTNTTSMTVPGGAGGAVSTNGDVNGGGAPGLPGIRIPGTAATAANSFHSGGGGSTLWGGGGVGAGTAGNGAAGKGFGAGGAGGLSNSAGANNGGAGTAGCILVEEYS